MDGRTLVLSLVCSGLTILGLTQPVNAGTGSFTGTTYTSPIPGTQVYWINPANEHLMRSEQRALVAVFNPFGKVTGVVYQNVDLVTGAFYGTFVLKRPNGSVNGTVTGNLTPLPPQGLLQVSEGVVFTGGTGAFAGMTGSGTATGVVDPSTGNAVEYDQGTYFLP